MESLLNQLSEVNTRYCELRPSLDTAEVKVRDLEAELERTKTQLEEQKALFEEQEERNKQMYLKMYAKGQEAARLELNDPVCTQAQTLYCSLRARHPWHAELFTYVHYIRAE